MKKGIIQSKRIIHLRSKLLNVDIRRLRHAFCEKSCDNVRNLRRLCVCKLGLKVTLKTCCSLLQFVHVYLMIYIDKNCIARGFLQKLIQ